MLPKNLLYQNKLAAAPAKSYSTLISPTSGNGPYIYDGTSSTIIINIPTGGNRVLNPADTYLKFTLNTKNGATASNFARLGAGGAHTVFQRLRLFHTALIEDVDDYALLASKMLVHTCPADAFAGRQSVLLGTTAEAAMADPTSSILVACPAGLKINSEGTTWAANAAYSETFCVSLLSIIGTLTDKYLPLFEMGAAPLRLELTTVNSALKVINSAQALSTTTSDHNINNVELCAAFIDLSDITIQQLRMSQGGMPLQMVIPSYRTYSTTLSLPMVAADQAATATTATPYTVVIPARFSSLKSLFVVMTDRSSGGATFYANASAHFNLNEYSFRVGSEIFPAKRPSSYAEFLAELSKALGSPGDFSAQGLVNGNTWTSDFSTNGRRNGLTVANDESAGYATTAAKEQSFMVGIDLEAYSNADRSSIYTGFNTLTTDIQFNPIHRQCVNTSNTAGTVNVKYNTYALFDQVLTFENGVANPTY